MKVLPGINIKREIDKLLEIGHDAENEQLAHRSNDATTSQTSTTRIRGDLTLSTEHSLSLVSAPFASKLLQTIRLTNIPSASPTSLDDYETDTTWTSYPLGFVPQYYGPSSMEALAQNAQLYLRPDTDENIHLRPEYWRTPRAENRTYSSNDPHILTNLQEDLPPEDLLPALIGGYFERVNITLPILHRPLFESQLRDGLHTRDEEFARLLLVVCALGARWCEDRRVLDDQCSSELSAGYRWFRSAYRGMIDAVYRPSLINIQFTLLSFAFLLGTKFHNVAWHFVAKASRMLQTLGAHRRKPSHTLADELLKRSFRCCFILDRFVSTTLGRPSVFRNIDIDVDDMMEIDDLFWTQELGARPPLSHSGSLQLAALNHTSRLCTIIGQASQTIFAPANVKVRIGLGSSQGEEWISRNLNQQLNRWAASVPANLRLPDPERFGEHPVPHLHSITTLWTGYCYAAIYINRPFITSRTPEIAATSFHNCRQAAHQCARMIHAYDKIPGSLPLQCAIPGVFSSAMVLIIDLIANSRPERLEEVVTSDSPGYSIVANE
ncbi:unnamed protein product, partial [Rhizoctonia solani]